MSEAYTLDTVHEEIAEVYRWFAREAPGVTPREEGVLGALWALADALHEEENDVAQ